MLTNSFLLSKDAAYFFKDFKAFLQPVHVFVALRCFVRNRSHSLIAGATSTWLQLLLRGPEQQEQKWEGAVSVLLSIWLHLFNDFPFLLNLEHARCVPQLLGVLGGEQPGSLTCLLEGLLFERTMAGDGLIWGAELVFRLVQHTGMQWMKNTEAVLSLDSRGRELEFDAACDGYPPAGCGGWLCTGKQHPYDATPAPGSWAQYTQCS